MPKVEKKKIVMSTLEHRLMGFTFIGSMECIKFVVQLDFLIETQGTAQIFTYAWMEAELLQALSHSVAVEMIAITPISSSALGFIFFLFMLNFRILLCAVLFCVPTAIFGILVVLPVLFICPIIITAIFHQCK